MTTISPTPGHLFANIPGILGYYPHESLILMCFLPGSGSGKKKLGPVIRLDLWQDEALGNLADTVDHYDPEFILAFMITSAEHSAHVSAIAGQLQRATEGRQFPAPITACWVTSELITTNSYRLVFDLGDPQFDDVRRYGRGWRKGRIEQIAASASCKALLEEGTLPEINRETAVSHFALEQAVGVTGARRNTRRAIRRGSAMLARIHAGTQELGEELDQVGRLCREAQDNPSLAASSQVTARVAALLSHGDLRDCLVMELMECPVGARLLCLEVARTHVGRVRANALCLFALCSFNSPVNMRGYHALQTVLSEEPEHRLGNLLVQSYVRGNISGVIAAAQRGSARARAELSRSA